MSYEYDEYYDKEELIDTLNSQMTKISDLEAKLEESEKKIDKARKQALSERQIDNEIKLNCLKEQITGKEKRITELKQQLAQKDKQLEKLKSENHALISDNAYQEADMFEFNSRIEQLQKQLAEKEHTINTLIEDHKASQEWYKMQLAEKEKYIEDYSAFFNQLFNQDKISFALEQLEKVKYYAQHIQGGLINYIDNQIKQLNEME